MANDGSSIAMVGTGTKISFSDWAESPIVLDVNPPTYGRGYADTTHMGTRTANQKTRGRPGFSTSLPSKLIDPGEASFDIAFQPEFGIPPVGIKQDITITFPDDTTWEFEGFVTDYSPKVPLEDRMTASITIKATGGLTVTHGVGS
jgi:hypothetical protein